MRLSTGCSRSRAIFVGILAVAWCMGCARVEPIGGPESADLRVTVDSLKSAVRDAQRTVADLRIELEDRRKELADVQVGRAQLQGMLREAERRLLDARHIIDLQREELASARVEREHVAQSGRRLHSRMRKLEKLLAQGTKQPAPNGETAPTAYAPYEPPAAATIPMSVRQSVVSKTPAGAMTANASLPEVSETSEFKIPVSVRTIVVREGETLWRLAHRHRVNLDEFKKINGITDNRIVAGSTLRLPESQARYRFRPQSPIDSK
jgi:LysM repeat protein